MTGKRFWHKLRLVLCRNAVKRANYIRDNQLFRHVGKAVIYQTYEMPLYPELISIHDNVRLASRVHFVTHDVAHSVLNHPSFGANEKFQEKIGCIEIMDNVFVGAGTLIMYNVRIGSNVIIGAESVVTKDLAPNAVYAGSPACRICSMDEYLEKLRSQKQYPSELRPGGEAISKELADYMWAQFAAERDGK